MSIACTKRCANRFPNSPSGCAGAMPTTASRKAKRGSSRVRRRGPKAPNTTWVGRSIRSDQAWSGCSRLPTEYNFAVADAKDGSFLGSCGLSQVSSEDRIANLGYWVRSGRTRMGVATAAAQLVARFGFDELQLNRIQIIAAISNRASLRVAEKAGAIREGILRSRFVIRGTVHDAVMFSLIPKDLKHQTLPSNAVRKMH